MIGAILDIVATGAKAALAWIGWRKQASDQNVGRQLQTSDNLQATAKGGQNAQRVREEVAALDDDALNDELRGDGDKGAASRH